MSVTDDLYTGTGYPGGIFNSGFAQSWIQERMDDAEPAPGGRPAVGAGAGQAGDKHCRANQRLRLQTQDALALQKRNPFRTPSLFAQRAPGPWLKRAKVPVFLVGQFQDEQTGGHFAESLEQPQRATRRVWISLQNGVHADSLGPSTITRWVEFLKLYVADEVPNIPPSIIGAERRAVPVPGRRRRGAGPAVALRGLHRASPPRRPSSRSDPRVRLLMDNGAGPQGPGSIGATWELGFGAWPPREARATRYYLGAQRRARRPSRRGELVLATPPIRARGPSRRCPATAPRTPGRPSRPYNWAPVAAGKGLGLRHRRAWQQTW